MRIGETSPWFRASLFHEISPEAVRAMEPRDVTVKGITDKANVFHTVRLQRGGVDVASATARKAPDALRSAVAKLDVPVEIRSLLTPDNAA